MIYEIRFSLTRARWRVLFLLIALISFSLSGCAANGEKKPTVRVRIRPNHVAAQGPQNRFAESLATPTPWVRTEKPDTTASSKDITERVISEATGQPTPEPTPTLPPIPLGRPERIIIPSIAVDAKVVPVGTDVDRIGNQWFQKWETASYAAGYHEGSALLGETGNTVISGHNNIDGAVFRDLYQVQSGDTVQLYADGFRYDYVVEDQFIVREAGTPLEQRIQNATWIQPTLDERVTLVSCWPPTGNDYRVIVVARPLRQGLAEQQAQHPDQTN
ncbi:MAG: sortase [Gammaproteobacteria bacterium]|nr:MAG: sortase [Gammaproteobacteria bacterium]